MPTFIDHHEHMPLPPQAQLAELRERVSAPPDEKGVKGVNILFARDGSAYCIFEAPDARAVIEAHEASGVPVSESSVIEITTLV